MFDSRLIRNFAIIAHVDHGKSTLADRFLEMTGVVEVGRHDEQYLDRNPISRERGITIKLAPVRMEYKFPISNSQFPMKGNSNSSTTLEIRNWKLGIKDSKYILNLIDTPGHVDFSYEVDRTLACVEGVILIVDATQGIQAQTISNAYKAIEKNLVIIPVINKIDLPNAQVSETRKQIVDFLGIDASQIFEVSAKTGLNVKRLLDEVVKKIPPPPVLAVPLHDEPIKALVFDSYYDPHKGVIAFVRAFSGIIEPGMVMALSQTTSFKVVETGIFFPDLVSTDMINSGEIGYVVTNLKDIHEVQVGDTLMLDARRVSPLAGYKKVKPMVFASIFTTETADYLNLKKALEKLYLNDSSLSFSAIHSQALGAGFRVGFLGLLHADVVRERLEREFNLSLVLTPPQVEYRQVYHSQMNLLRIYPSKTALIPLSGTNQRKMGIHENVESDKLHFEEPIVKLTIITPHHYLGSVMQLCQDYRATFVTMDNKSQISLTYEMPLSEMISDFYDQLKSITSGYASLDWELVRYVPVEADKLTLLLNGSPVEEFSQIVVRERSFDKARMLVDRLKELIPRQQYEVKIQALYKGKIIASSRIAPFRKDVLVKNSKVVGAGDFGRKRKLLEKQKEGKKKMKMIGKVEIPKEAFLKLFKTR